MSSLQTYWLPPRDLVTPERYDIPVKVRFLCHLAHGRNPDAERVYRWHIEKRTGGVELRSWKRTVDDYVTAARDLLLSMERGYKLAHPVVVGSNGRLMEGAHRIACALVWGRDVYVQRRDDKPGNAAPWGLEWFRRNGMSAADLTRLDRDFRELTAS